MVKRIRIAESDKWSGRRKIGNRSVKEARQKITNYLDFSELSEDQRKQAVEKFLDSDTAYEWFNDDQMILYKDEVQYMADELNGKTGIDVNPDKIYWQCSSQGPYPEWKIEDIFDSYSGDANGTDYEFDFYGGRSTDVDFGSIYVYTDGEWVDFDDSELRENGFDAVADAIESKVNAAQKFINDVWRLIRDVCTAYPDEEWAYEMLEANDYEFEIDDDGNVVRMA
jgi:hypothetical protein